MKQFSLNESQHNLIFTPNDPGLHGIWASSIKGLNPIGQMGKVFYLILFNISSCHENVAKH